MRDRNIACVIVDSDKQALRDDLTADFCYLRLQRNDASEPEGYARAALDNWATRITSWSHDRNAFVYFISGDKAYAPAAARAFLSRL